MVATLPEVTESPVHVSSLILGFGLFFFLLDEKEIEGLSIC